MTISPSERELAFLGAAEARSALAGGKFSAVDYVSTLLARIERTNDHFHAFISISAEQALRSARNADRRRSAGLPLPPLHGLPFAVKDLIDLRGDRTGAHSRVAAEPARRTAESILRIRRQGGIYLGKLALEEFGIGSPLDDLSRPLPRNPWDQRRTAGGSSGGSAVALAAGLVPLALGTDTGGSVRAPAAHCGLVALKPSAGRVGMRGVQPLAPSLDALGPMARSGKDCALLFSALIGSDRRRGFEPGRIGLVDTGSAGLQPDRQVKDAIAAALEIFTSLGADIEATGFPDFRALQTVGKTILGFEAYHVHRQRLDREGPLYGEICRRRLSAGQSISEASYSDALERRERLRAEVDELFERYDVLALPTTLGAAALLEDLEALERSDNGIFRIGFNVTGHPAIVFCVGFESNGLPLSMQLVGRHGEDERLLNLVIAYQTATSWHEMHPPNLAGGGEG